MKGISEITKPITDMLNVRKLVGIAATIAVVFLMIHFFVDIQTDSTGETHFSFKNPFAK